jgi:hypothetical protein
MDPVVVASIVLMLLIAPAAFLISGRLIGMALGIREIRKTLKEILHHLKTNPPHDPPPKP